MTGPLSLPVTQMGPTVAPSERGVCVQFLAMLSLFAGLTVVNRQCHLAQPRVDLSCIQAMLSLFARLTVVNRQRHLAQPRVDCVGVCTVTCTRSVR